MAEETADDHLYSVNRDQTAKHFQSSEVPPRQSSSLRTHHHQPLHTLGANDLRLDTSRTPPPAHMGWTQQGGHLQVQRPSPHGSPFLALPRPSSRSSPMSQQVQRPSPYGSPFAQLHPDDGGTMTMTQLQSILAMPAAMLTKPSPGGAGSRASPVHPALSQGGIGSRVSPVHPALSQGMTVLHSSGLVCPPPRGVPADRLPMPLLLQMVTSDAAHRAQSQNSMPIPTGDRLHESMSDMRRYPPPRVTVSSVESQDALYHRERDVSRATVSTVESQDGPYRDRDGPHFKSSPHHRPDPPRHLANINKQPNVNVDFRYTNNNSSTSETVADARISTKLSSLSPPPALLPATNDAAPRMDTLRVGMLERQVSASMPTLLPAVSLPGGDGTDEDKENEEDDGVDPDERKHAYNMRKVTLDNLLNSNTSCRSAYRSHSIAILRAKAGSISNTAKSLDLLRQNLQKHINKEIDETVQKYIKQFFLPSVINIRANNGEAAVNDDHILAICRQVLEEAKKMYPCELSRSVTPDLADSVSESGSLIENSTIRANKHSLFRIRKRRGSSDSDASVHRVRKKKGRPPLHHQGTSGRSTPSKTHKSDTVRREGPKWEPDRIKTDTLFVMGAKANKALGLGQTRGRLYIKHPDVFKYSGDQDDKQWLYENGRMPATGGKAYMLLVSDVTDLADAGEYRGSSALQLDELRGFTLPEWMLTKVSAQMAAMRTDSLKDSKPIESFTAKLPEQMKTENDGTLPFSSTQYTGGVKKPSEEMSAVTDRDDDDDDDDDDEDDDTRSISSFHLSGGFGDVSPAASVSPAPSDLETLDGDVTVPFELPD